MALLPLPEENPIQALSSCAGNEVGAAVAQHSINQQLPSSSDPASLPTQEFGLEGLQEWKWLTSRLQHCVHMFSSTLTEQMATVLYKAKNEQRNLQIYLKNDAKNVEVAQICLDTVEKGGKLYGIFSPPHPHHCNWPYKVPITVTGPIRYPYYCN